MIKMTHPSEVTYSEAEGFAMAVLETRGGAVEFSGEEFYLWWDGERWRLEPPSNITSVPHGTWGYRITNAVLEPVTYLRRLHGIRLDYCAGGVWLTDEEMQWQFYYTNQDDRFIAALSPETPGPEWQPLTPADMERLGAVCLARERDGTFTLTDGRYAI